MNFRVKNRREIHNAFFPGGTAILISITDPDKNHCIPSGKYRDVLCVKFHDADVGSPGVQVIDKDIANRILEFVINNLDVDYVVVNCEAGISRSAGVAAALSSIFNGDDSDIVKIKPFYNKKVCRTILNVWNDLTDKVRSDLNRSFGELASVQPIPPDTLNWMTNGFFSDHCPDCGSLIINGDGWSGVKCSNENCAYWFCY